MRERERRGAISESLKSIDARGLPCPQPVILAKKALEAGGFELLEIIVDGPSARENVSRFARHEGHLVESVKEGEAGAATILIRRSAGPGGNSGGGAQETARAAGAPSSTLAPSGVATLFISSAALGTGNDELGALLMKGFISTLTEAERLPQRIIFMNGGVLLAVEGSAGLDKLAALAARGVEILSCGTCLDFYKVKDKLAVGRVTNMFEIAGLLLQGSVLRL